MVDIFDVLPRKGFDDRLETNRSDELRANGYTLQGVLRRFNRESDQQFAAAKQQFNSAVAKARAEGKDVEIVTHSLGSDWWWKHRDDSIEVPRG